MKPIEVLKLLGNLLIVVLALGAIGSAVASVAGWFGGITWEMVLIALGVVWTLVWLHYRMVTTEASYAWSRDYMRRRRQRPRD